MGVSGSLKNQQHRPMGFAVLCFVLPFLGSCGTCTLNTVAKITSHTNRECRTVFHLGDMLQVDDNK